MQEQLSTNVAKVISMAHRYVVKNTSPRGAQKRVMLSTPSGEEFGIELHRFAMVGPGDILEIRPGLETRIACLLEDSKEKIPVSPAFEAHQNINFAGERVALRIAEVTTAGEMADLAYLEGFHYRGLDLSVGPNNATPKKGIGGRRALLMLQLKLPEGWRTAGYIEIQMPLMMAKPRHQAFSRPFKHPVHAVEWDTWKKGGQALVNHIARIARVVVHPEFRGANLSQPLVSAAIEFARDRWHIGGKKCLFLEISAEMLKHIDFVSPAGFHYLGDTEGNKRRIAKDLISIENGASGASGIMSLQRRYHSIFAKYQEQSGETLTSAIARLNEILQAEDPWQEMAPEEWLALRPIVRSSIPYYMVGLDQYSNDYVRSAAIDRPKNRKQEKIHSACFDLEIKDLEVWSNYKVPLSTHSRLVMDGFGITNTDLAMKLVGPVEFSAAPGTVTLIAGSSGCGKSLLLSALDPTWKISTAGKNGFITPQNYIADWLRPIEPDLPLFESLATIHGADRTFDALARVGLSEALLFLKPFWMLSRGQRYRAMLADLLLRNNPVWLIDEFCSDLDPVSARIVAQRLRETVQREGRIAIVAAANHGHFLHALRPTQVLVLATHGCSVTKSWKDHADALQY